MSEDTPLPLEGIKVIDIATVLGAPVAATLLAEFGAEVIKVEEPTTGDLLRQFGQPVNGVPLQWLQEARNKKSVTLDLRQAEGQALLKQMIKTADVLVENFRPGTLEKWDLGYEALSAINPKLVVLHITGYGRTGPYAHKGAFDRVASAFAGLTETSGFPDGPPVRQSFALADYLAASYGAFAVMTALYHRDLHDGPGQEIDLALYEGILRSSESMLTVYKKLGHVRTRQGNRNPGVVPAGQYDTADGRLVIVHAGTDALWARLAPILGGEALDPALKTSAGRKAQGDRVEKMVTDWAAGMNATDLLALLDKAGIPAERLNTVVDIAEDPHIQLRNILDWDDARVGPISMIDVVPKLSKTPGRVRWTGPDKGAHNDEIYAAMGLDAAAMAKLKAKKVI